MSFKLPAWLPPLICFSDPEFKRDPSLYTKYLFSIFKKDFIDSNPFYNKKQIFYDKRITTQDKPEGFWHLVTEVDKETGERNNADLRRSERLCWIRPIIENFNDPLVSVYEKVANKKIRTCFLLEDYDFLVILHETKYGYYLVTSYYLNWPNSKRKAINDRDSYIKQESSQ